MQLQHDYVSFVSIVDLHAITIPYEAAEMPKRVEDLALTLYACGLDFEKTTLFVQSEVPGHADLTWIFNTITPLGELERMTQFKDKREQFRATVNVGLLDYPVLQAADILIYKGEVVPVGQDQVQHVEFTREVARHFNSRFGDTFPECQALLTNTPKVARARRRRQDEQEQGQHHRRAGDPRADLGQAAPPRRPTRPGSAAPTRHAREVHDLVVPPPGDPGGRARRDPHGLHAPRASAASTARSASRRT